MYLGKKKFKTENIKNRKEYEFNYRMLSLFTHLLTLQ